MGSVGWVENLGTCSGTREQVTPVSYPGDGPMGPLSLPHFWHLPLTPAPLPPCPMPFTGRLQGPCRGEAADRHDEGQGRASGLHSVHRGRQVGGGGEQDLVIPHLVIPFHTLTSSCASGTRTGVTRTCLSQSRRLARRRAWWPRSLSARWVDGSGWWLVVGGYVHGGRDI